MSQTQVEWIEIVQPVTKQQMYANLITGECCWDPPAGSKIKRTHENQWWELYDQSTGRFYYYNPSTRRTVWQRPHNCDIIPLAKLQTVKQNTESRRRGRSGSGPSLEPVQVDVSSCRMITYDELPFSFGPDTINSPSTTTGTTLSSGQSACSSRSSSLHYRDVESRSVGCQTQTSPVETKCSSSSCTSSSSSVKPKRQMAKGDQKAVCSSVSCQTALSSSHLLKRHGGVAQLHQRRRRSSSQSKRDEEDELKLSIANLGSGVQQALIKSLNPALANSNPKSVKGCSTERRACCTSVTSLPSVENDHLVSSSYAFESDQAVQQLSSDASRLLKFEDHHRHRHNQPKRRESACAATQSYGKCCSTPARRRLVEKCAPEACSVSFDSSDPFNRARPGAGRSPATGPSCDGGQSLTWGKMNRQRSLDVVAGQFAVTGSCGVRMSSARSFRHCPNKDACKRVGEQPLAIVAGSPQLWQAIESPVPRRHNGPSATSVDASCDATIWKSHDSGIRSGDSYPRGDDSSSQASAESPRLCDSGHPSTNGSTCKSPKMASQSRAMETSTITHLDKAPSGAVANPMYEQVAQHLTYSQLHQQFIVGNSFQRREAHASSSSSSSSSGEESARDDDDDEEELFADDEEGGAQMATPLTSSQEEEEEDLVLVDRGVVDFSNKTAPTITTLPRTRRTEGPRSPIYDVPEGAELDQSRLDGPTSDADFGRHHRSSSTLSESEVKLADREHGSPSSSCTLGKAARQPAKPSSSSAAELEFHAHERLNKHTKGLFRKRQSVQSVLSWTRDELKKPLIMTTDKALKKDACEMFKRVQAYMGDRKVKSNVSMDQLALDVCMRGWKKPALRDELFLQLCKQTTENARAESARRGWELLCICLKFFPPSAVFTSYLDSYVQRYADPVLDVPEVAISQYAQHCCKRLERVAGQSGRPVALTRQPTVDEIEQARVEIFHPSMFGNTLDEVIAVQRERFASRRLPWIQTTLSELVLQLNGAKTEGIFRVPGDIDEVNALKARVDRWLVPPVSDPHVPASLLKLWYRELAEPLVPHRLYDQCIQASGDPERCCQLVDRLPAINRHVLVYLIRFLQIFIRPENVALTKMDSNNLAMVMAPNCLRCQSDNPAVMFDNARKEMLFLRNLMERLDTSSSLDALL